MALLLIEGCRRSGKTYLTQKQDTLPVFKFDFNTNFSLWNFEKNNESVHWLGLGKEIMLHELDQSGYLPKMIIDRGILTNTVWGVFQKRITIQEARKDLENFVSRGFFKGCKILLVSGVSLNERTKDIWDEEDKRGPEETYLFHMFSDVLKDLGVDVTNFTNDMDESSVARFKTITKEF